MTRRPRRSPKWSARSFKRTGVIFVCVGLVGGITVEVLNAMHRIDPEWRSGFLKTSATWILVGGVAFFVGRVKEKS